MVGVSIGDEEPSGGAAERGDDVDVGGGEAEGLADAGDGQDGRVDEDAGDGF